MAADATVTMKYNADTTAAKSSMNSFGSVLTKIGGLMGVAFSVQAIKQFADESIKAYNAQIEAETKLTTVMKRRMNATDAQVQSVKDLASAQQELGVIGDELQLAGAQQLATFLNQTESVNSLIPAMNNLAAQQNGVNVTSENMVNIANLMGKALEGNVGALTRVGISFTDAQAQVLKYGDESERAAMLAQVITDNVGQMNVALAQTDAGKIKQAENTIGDLKEEIGEQLIPTQLAWAELQRDLLVPALGEVMKIIGLLGNGLAALASGFKNGGKEGKTVAGIMLGVAAAIGTLLVVQKAHSAILVLQTAQTYAAAAAEGAEVAMTEAQTAAKTKLLAASKALNTTLIALVAMSILMIANADQLTTGMKVAAAGVVALTVVLAIVKISALAAAGTFTILGIAVNAALWPVLAVVAAIAGVIAIIAIFTATPYSKEAKRIKEDTEAMNTAFDEATESAESEAVASEKLANQLVELSKKSNKTSSDIALMEVKANLLNETLGDGVVAVDKNTGALTLNGEALDENGTALLDLIAAKKSDAKATALQEAASKAYTLQAEAEANYVQALEAAQESQTFANIWGLQKSKEALDEANASVESYDQQYQALIETQAKEQEKAAALETQAAANMTEEQKRQAIRDQMNADRELTTSEHYTKLQEMMSSNYAELGLTEEEYIAQMAEHQQAIEDATQEHVDTLFGINEEGLYNESNTVDELNEIWTKNQIDMSNYYTNLNTLSEAGFEDLVKVFEDGGVEMGGSLQNVMDGLQGISIDGWNEIKADWDANGGELSTGMKEKFGDVNVEAGLAVLELSNTTQKGFEDAAEYGTGGFEPIVDDTTDIMTDVNTEVEQGGKTTTETASKAGDDASQGFIDAAGENLDDVATMGKLTGNSYVGGLLIGLEAMRSSLVAKAKSLAYSMNIAYQNALDIDSPSKVAIWNSKMYGKGIELGLEDSKKGVEREAADLASMVLDASSLIYTPPFMGVAGGASNNYYYTDSQTDARHEGPLLNIENYNQNSDQDQQSLVQKLEIARKERALAIGAKA
jgi:hypothetical protein